MDDKLHEKVVVVTGGSSGIGRALVEEALRRGARVAACGRSLARLEAAFPQRNGRLLLSEADVSRADDCLAFIATVEERWGGVDVLLANAGISMRALFKDADLAVLHELMNVNFWGAVNITKAALPSILARRGAIVGISSWKAYVPSSCPLACM
jgi:NAD(P)-dependent dehydrogenase (short-subunit alcohol dehydrogenase family)